MGVNRLKTFNFQHVSFAFRSQSPLSASGGRGRSVHHSALLFLLLLIDETP